jgi:diguanylate cyclase (GGDEF)-like protein
VSLTTPHLFLSGIPSGYRLPLAGLALLTIIFVVSTAREHVRSRRAQQGALTDPLTGLPNRQAFEQRLDREWKRAQRYGRPLGLLLIDLDDFKRINDTRGHAEGDRVLEQVAERIGTSVRETDLAARLSGDEFVVLCPEANRLALERLARSLQGRLEEVGVRMSVGFTEREPADTSPSVLVKRADAAMYRDKRREHPDGQGRLRLVEVQPG